MPETNHDCSLVRLVQFIKHLIVRRSRHVIYVETTSINQDCIHLPTDNLKSYSLFLYPYKLSAKSTSIDYFVLNTTSPASACVFRILRLFGGGGCCAGICILPVFFHYHYNHERFWNVTPAIQHTSRISSAHSHWWDKSFVICHIICYRNILTNLILRR